MASRSPVTDAVPLWLQDRLTCTMIGARQRILSDDDEHGHKKGEFSQTQQDNSSLIARIDAGCESHTSNMRPIYLAEPPVEDLRSFVLIHAINLQ